MKSLFRSLGSVALVVALLLTGCTPADPLDWKIQAGTPAEYDRWTQKKMPLMDDELARQLTYAFATLSATTDTPHKVTNRREYLNEKNAFCMQISGLTVRQVITEGCRAANITILQEINKESQKLRDLLTTYEELETGSPRAAQLERLITYRRKTIENCHATITQNNAILAKVTGPADAR